ncbi:MAG: hypothetical protein ACR2HH_15315 [Chthoniobacterales bacterium]
MTNYKLDALNRTGSNGLNDNGVLTSFTANAMNQYGDIVGQGVSYDGNFNLTADSAGSGWSYVFNAAKRFVR